MFKKIIGLIQKIFLQTKPTKYSTYNHMSFFFFFFENQYNKMSNFKKKNYLK